MAKERKTVSFASEEEIPPVKKVLPMTPNPLDKIPPALSYLEKNKPDPKRIDLPKPLDYYNKKAPRPLRHIKHIPTKAVGFANKETELVFNYSQIDLPIRKTDLIVKVEYACLNPIDVQIINSYVINLSGDKGVGREFSGYVDEVGESLQNEYQAGDKVVGIYYHPEGKGTLSTHLLMNPKIDKIVKVPRELVSRYLEVNLNRNHSLPANHVYLDDTEGSSSSSSSTIVSQPAPNDTIPTMAKLASFPLNFNMAEQCLSHSVLSPSSSVLINGGNTQIGIILIQLLRLKHNVEEISCICSIESTETMLRLGASQVFNYNILYDGLILKGESPPVIHKSQSVLLGEISTYIEHDSARKYDLIVDLIGGSLFMGSLNNKIANTFSGKSPEAPVLSILKPKNTGSAFVTTVGSNKANYDSDVYSNAINPLNPWSLGANWASKFGNSMSTYNYFQEFFKPELAYIEDGFHMITNNQLQYPIDDVYEWKDFKKQISNLRTRRNRGKIILRVEEF